MERTFDTPKPVRLVVENESGLVTVHAVSAVATTVSVTAETPGAEELVERHDHRVPAARRHPHGRGEGPAPTRHALRAPPGGHRARRAARRQRRRRGDGGGRHRGDRHRRRGGPQDGQWRRVHRRHRRRAAGDHGQRQRHRRDGHRAAPHALGVGRPALHAGDGPGRLRVHLGRRRDRRGRRRRSRCTPPRATCAWASSTTAPRWPMSRATSGSCPWARAGCSCVRSRETWRWACRPGSTSSSTCRRWARSAPTSLSRTRPAPGGSGAKVDLSVSSVSGNVEIERALEHVA